ncbi:MAG: hypothetical protein DRJ41_00750 [Thermoprotei archaeon]|nr:MAG: hypothetical protein DRJ41_00750 [Thermoprotei archaeon]HDI31650.1 hypothetical protein [Thermofilum sp.]
MAERSVKNNLITGLVVGFLIAALFSAFLVVVKEENKGVKDWLAGTFTHHWIGHGVLTLVVFFMMTLVAAKYCPPSSEKMLSIAIWAATIINLLVIIGYYVLHFPAK